MQILRGIGIACFLVSIWARPAEASEIVLYSFTGGADGSNPQAHLIRDSAGNLYGTTYFGGTAFEGVVYKVNANGHETVLYSFTGLDGSNPIAGVIRISGNLYGTTFLGGTSNGGVVYKLDSTGHETVLYSFTGGADGANPIAGVIRDSAGNLYGTTAHGGASSQGVVCKLDTTGHETVLYTFTGEADGGNPSAGLIRDSAGNLYGTTFLGGDLSHCAGIGCGVVYKLDTTGHETVLHSFTGGADGSNPYAGVIRVSGNLYGTTFQGGNLSHCGGIGCGVVYKLDTSGHETVLRSFTGGAGGANLYAGVIHDSAGNLYRATNGGGKYGSGVVFKLTP